MGFEDVLGERSGRTGPTAVDDNGSSVLEAGFRGGEVRRALLDDEWSDDGLVVVYSAGQREVAGRV